MKKKRLLSIAFLLIVILSGIWYSSYKNSSELTFAKDNKIYYDNIDVVDSFKETVEKDKIININIADAQKLMTLERIGEKTAEAIIEYRTENGNFKKIEDIKNVKGIGDKTFEGIKNFITVEGEEYNGK